MPSGNDEKMYAAQAGAGKHGVCSVGCGIDNRRRGYKGYYRLEGTGNRSMNKNGLLHFAQSFFVIVHKLKSLFFIMKFIICVAFYFLF